MTALPPFDPGNPALPDYVLGMPEGVAALSGIPDGGGGECLFAVRGDLTLAGEPAVCWLLVFKDRAGAVVSGEDGKASWVAGPYLYADADKVRTFQMVGSAFLQFRVQGVFADAARYSNRRREWFERARQQIERLMAGKPFQPDAIARASELTCPACGLPRGGRNASCPRCERRQGAMMRSVALLKVYRGPIIALVSMMVMGVLLDLVPPLLTRTLVDRVLIPRRQLNWLPIILSGVVFCSAARQTLAVFIGRLATYISTRLTRDLRERLERKIVHLSLDYFDRQSVGGLMSRVLYDVELFHSLVIQLSQGFLLNLLLVVGIGIVLCAMNWFLAFLVILPVPAVGVATVLFWRRIRPMFFCVSDSQSRLSRALTGLFSGIRLVKAFGQEQREHDRFSRALQYNQTNRRTLESNMAVFNPAVAFIFGLGGLTVWYAGGHMVLNDTLSLGTLMAFMVYLAMFYAPVTALSMFSNWLSGFVASSQRIFEVLDAGTSLNEPAPETAKRPHIRGEIEFRDVVFGYDPYTPILKGVSFKVEPGQFVGIVGKSGAGKSTVINLVCRFYDPQQGEVLIDGVNVKNVAADHLHQEIGLVLQDPFLFRATIYENIAYGRPRSSPSAIMDAARAANAHEFIIRKPLGYDTRLGEGGAGLSGGERQRVSIARAILCDPRILILDEATSSVDTESEQEIQRALAVLARNRTVIAIAHRLSTLKNADRIYVVDNGMIAESGSHEELLGKQGIYHRLVKIQTELTRLES